MLRLANLELHKEPHEGDPLETDRLMMEGSSNKVPNGNGYVMKERHHPTHNPAVFEERGRTTPTLKGYKSNDSTQSTRSLPLTKYDRSNLRSIGVLGNGFTYFIFSFINKQ